MSTPASSVLINIVDIVDDKDLAIINKPNMGLLASNQAGYNAGSNFARASALRGRLKIMHGTRRIGEPLDDHANGPGVDRSQ